MHIDEELDVGQLRKALRALLDRDVRESGEHISEDTPGIALATSFILNFREIIEYNLARGWKP